ncbi:hypothetical protein HanXRQr2_Chr12g0528791 [Helianthus annuus]|uniref:Uncharacterized protein n=1 Tax=Helianthus annuus TaxID=4232 RepID=A0A9K3EPV6_HELAN|nr:hypothetical protein HanXRQr2_Chr12g0528791 [Helianthus annuus]KAJ0861687.1 hypothetical protein HanPSC8_Chr12g0509461 [Helianthus annuus]
MLIYVFQQENNFNGTDNGTEEVLLITIEFKSDLKPYQNASSHSMKTIFKYHLNELIEIPITGTANDVSIRSSWLCFSKLLSRSVMSFKTHK